jgi:hypothetical protein
VYFTNFKGIEMKISGFVAVMERFWTRAQMLFPEKPFTAKVIALSDEVRRALADQLGIAIPTDDSDFPLEEKMGEAAVSATNELCRYLDEHDQGIGYQAIAERN